jgi:hypothetical protein
MCRTNNMSFSILNYLVFLEFKVFVWIEKIGNKQGLWQGGRMELLQPKRTRFKATKNSDTNIYSSWGLYL